MAFELRRSALMLAALGGLTVAPAIAGAQQALAQEGDVTPQTRMGSAVTAAMAKQVGDLLEADRTIGLFLVAYQRVVGDTCEGFAVDEAKNRAVMDGLLADLAGRVEEGQNNLPLDVVMVAYGIGVGGQTAVAAYDTERFCADATEFREQLKKEGNDRFAILSPAS